MRGNAAPEPSALVINVMASPVLGGTTTVAANSPVRTQVWPVWHAITTVMEWRATDLVRIDNGVLDGFAAHAMASFCRDNQINAQPLGGDHTEPGADTLMSAFLGPSAPQAGEMHVGGAIHEVQCSDHGRRNLPKALNEKHGTAAGKKSGDLAA